MMKNKKNPKKEKKIKSIYLIAADEHEFSYRYFSYFVSCVSACADKVVLLTNGNVWQRECITERKVFIVHTDEIYDVEKWRKYIIGNWDEINGYDELYLLNTSVFGPVYDLFPMIEKMCSRENDFWGITRHKPVYVEHKPICDSFLQRYFLCFRRSVLEELYRFLRTMPEITSYEEAERRFEFTVTPCLEKKYKSDVYCNTDFLEGKDREYAVSHICCNLDFLMEKYRLPFVPKVIFQQERMNELEYRDGMQAFNVLKGIRRSSKYDVDMILEYLIGNSNVYDNLINLNLYFTLEEKAVNRKGYLYRKNALVIAYLYYMEAVEERLGYLAEISSIVDILIATDDKKKAEKLKKMVSFKARIVLTEKRGREWGALLISCRNYIKKYRYVCFVHDKRSEYLAYTSLGKSFQNLLWENMLGSKEYVKSILEFMEKYHKAGLLLPPLCHMGVYNSLYGDYWSVCYEETLALAEKIGIQKYMINREKPPISIGSCFWCRTEALSPLWEHKFTYEDFCSEPMPIDGTINHALERILPYIAQQQGFLSVIVMKEAYGRLYHSNLEYMLQKMLKALKKKSDYLGTFPQMLEWLKEKDEFE